MTATPSTRRKNRRPPLRPARRRLTLESLEERSLLALVSYWSADNTAIDPISGNNGTLYNGASYAAGQVGQAFSFDGVDDRVNVADSPTLALTHSMTIETWLKANAIPAQGQQGEILFRGDDRAGLDPYSLSLQANGQLRFEVVSGPGATDVWATLPLGQFVHVACTLDDATGEMDIYLNGVLASQTSTTVRPFGALDPSSNPGVGIGNHGGYPTTPHNFPFNGLIDELKLYDNALTKVQVQADFTSSGGLVPISISNATAQEGNSAQFTVSLAFPSTQTVTVNYATADGTATVGADYTTAAGTLTFAPGQTSQTVAIQTIDDSAAEGSETFVVDLSSANGGTIADGQGTGTIAASDQPITISISDATAVEGSSALKILGRFVSDNSGGLTRPRTPVFGPDGNGDGIQDLYVASADTSEVLRFNGATGAFLDTFVTANSGGLLSPSDLAFGPDGALYVSCAGNLPGIPPANGQGSILRYDGTTGAFLNVVASGLSAPLGITFGTDGSLYVANQFTNAVLRVSGGVTTEFVSAGSGGLDQPRNVLFGPDANGDSQADLYVSSAAYDAVLRYDGQTGAFIGKFASTGLSSGPLWMQFGPDGDLYATARTAATCCATGFVRFDGTTGAKIDSFDFGRDNWSFNFGPDGLIYLGGNGGGNYVDRVGPSSMAAFTVSLNNPSNAPVTVSYSTADGNAIAESDYAAAAGTLTFAPGQTSQTILVHTLNDTAVEPNETFTVNLSNASGGTIADGQATGTIFDDDLGLVSYWSGDNTAIDPISGNNGTLQNGATYAAGQVGQAFSFDGVDDQITVADSPSLQLSHSLTIEAWVKINSANNTTGFVLFRGEDRGGNPYQIFTLPGGYLRFQIESLNNPSEIDNANVQAPAPTGEFVHIAATLDDVTGAMKLYENGALVAQTTTSVRPLGALDPTLNPRFIVGSAGFSGLIDELKIYDQSLPGDRVLADYNSARGSAAPNLSIRDATTTEGSVRFGTPLGTLVPTNASGDLKRSAGMAIGPDGNLYVNSFSTNEVLRYDARTGAYLGPFVTSGSGGLTTPATDGLIFRPDGKLYVLSRDGNSVLRYNAMTGAFIDTFVAGGSGGLSQARGMAFGADGNLYISSTDTNQVLKYSGTTGAFLGVFVAAGSGGLGGPRSIAFGPDGNLYVASPGTTSVLRYSGTTGSFLNAFVASGAGGLQAPGDLLFDHGSLYVASQGTNNVLRYDASTGAFLDVVDPNNSPDLDRPIGLLLAPDGSLLVGAYSSIVRYGATTTTPFVVTLSSPRPDPITVNYATANGTAIAGSDYSTAMGTITFAPGEMTKTIVVTTIDDTARESTETLSVNLYNANGATISRATATGTIFDNDTRFHVVNDSTTSGTADGNYDYTTSGGGNGSYSLNVANTVPRGAASTAAGSYVWVVDANKHVYVYDRSGGLQGSWTAGSLPNKTDLQGISVSGNDVWIVDNVTDRVYQFDAATSRTSGSQSPSTSFSLAAGNTNPQGIADPPTAVAGSTYDSALLAVVGELDDVPGTGKKRR
jgi:outer membrane protein assembly factor BamB